MCVSSWLTFWKSEELKKKKKNKRKERQEKRNVLQATSVAREVPRLMELKLEKF